jgi:hypothetical protein
VRKRRASSTITEKNRGRERVTSLLNLDELELERVNRNELSDGNSVTVQKKTSINVIGHLSPIRQGLRAQKEFLPGCKSRVDGLPSPFVLCRDDGEFAVWMLSVPDASAVDCGTIIGRNAVLVSAPWRKPSDPPNGPDDHIDNVF